MEKTGLDYFSAIGSAAIGCSKASPGRDLDGARVVLLDAIEAYAPILEADRDYEGRAAVHQIADRWLGGIKVATLMKWADEPDG
jgi:hypothetical protein